MSKAWEEPGTRELVGKFLEEERQAGREYTVTETGPESVTKAYSVFAGGVPMADDVFRGHVTEFMVRHKWDRDGGVGPWVDFVAVAVQTYLLDVVQAK